MSAAPLPPWNASGLLDPGAHATDLDGVYDRFVLDAPERQVRELLFQCLTSYIKIVRPAVGPSRLWINGGFAMQKLEAPRDVDVVIFPEDVDRLNNSTQEELDELVEFLTLQSVLISSPWMTSIPRLQPMAGALDAFISTPELEHSWFETWSSVKRNGVYCPGEVKGFAEVRV